MSHSTQYLIHFYQKYISPYKGFRCAHGAYYGGDSCSGAVSKIIRRKGLINGFTAIKNQFRRCSHAYMKIKEKVARTKKNTYGNTQEYSQSDCISLGLYGGNCAQLPCACLAGF